MDRDAAASREEEHAPDSCTVTPGGAGSPVSRPASSVTVEVWLSLALALLVLLAGFFASTVWVAVDMRGLQETITRFFEVAPEPPPPLRSHYSAEAVAAKRQALLRTSKGSLFSTVPGSVVEHPSVEPVSAPSLPARLHQEVRSPELPPRPDALEALEQEFLREQVSAAVPVVARRPAGLSGRFPPPDLNALYRSGREGGDGPARPGGDLPALRAADSSPPPLPRMDSALPKPLPAFPEEPVQTAAAYAHVLLDQTPAARYPSLDEDVTADFAVYREAGTGERYFRLTLSVKPESTLPAIPQDVFFLLDTSQSVSDREYALLRQTVLRVLKTLPDGDRFNVALFSENTHFFSEDFLPAAEVRARWSGLKTFTRRRYDERTTDVFTALTEVLRRLPRSGRPTAFFLLSDGKATQGVDEVKTLVQGLARVNRASFAIHTFNAGEGGDRYLLMLLSYRSRGFYGESPDLRRAGAVLQELSARLSKPVLTNVVLSCTNVNPEEVYPGVLPSLYRDHPIVICGKGTVGREIVLRVAGFHRGKPREFFFRTVLPEGETDLPEVAREWATGKCHALMATLSQDPRNGALRQQIIELARAHNLPSILEMVERRGPLGSLRKLFDRMPEEAE